MQNYIYIYICKSYFFKVRGVLQQVEIILLTDGQSKSMQYQIEEALENSDPANLKASNRYDF